MQNCWINGPVAQPWRRPSPHGESLHAMAKPSPWRDFYDGDIAPRRHSSPFGDIHRHMATGVAKARRPRELDHILLSNAVPMLSKRWLPRCYLCWSVALWWSSSPFRDMRRRSALRATARHLVVQCKLSRPISPFRDRRGTAILAATAVAKVVQQAQCDTINNVKQGASGNTKTSERRQGPNGMAMSWSLKEVRDVSTKHMVC